MGNAPSSLLDNQRADPSRRLPMVTLDQGFWKEQRAHLRTHLHSTCTKEKVLQWANSLEKRAMATAGWVGAATGSLWASAPSPTRWSGFLSSFWFHSSAAIRRENTIRPFPFHLDDSSLDPRMHTTWAPDTALGKSKGLQRISWISAFCLPMA